MSVEAVHETHGEKLKTDQADGTETTKPDQSQAMETKAEGSDPIQVEGVTEDERIEVIRQIEFYFSDANLPYDKFMFLQTSPHLDPIKAPTLSSEDKKKAEDYGPGCSPVLLQTVASFKRMRPFSTKFPTSKIAQIIQTAQTKPQLVEVISQDLNGKPTFYVRRVSKLEEQNRAGASDRCVYAKGFLSAEEHAKGEPIDIQIRLEKWANQWGRVAVLRMRRVDPTKKTKKSNEESEAKEDKNAIKKWKNSVFIEYHTAASAEELVDQFKQQTDMPKFEGKELESIMFKIDYVAMKAKEMGLPTPSMSGNRQPSAPTKSSIGALGGNASSFNAFRELKAISQGKKQYACGKPGNTKETNNNEPPAALEIEYEGNKLEVEKDGSLKDPTQLKTYRENVALGFELKGEAPAGYHRVDFAALKKNLTEGDLVCRFVNLNKDDRTKGTIGFSSPVDDEAFAQLQAKGVETGGRPIELRRLEGDENRQYHLDLASHQAKQLAGPKTQDNRNGRGGSGGGGGRRDGGDNRRGGGRGRGRGRGHGRRDGPRDRNEEKNDQKSNGGQTEDTASHKAPSAANKRDVEGNLVSTNAPASKDGVPDIGRAGKKIKVDG